MSAVLVQEGYIGIDNGTQGLSVIFTDTNLKVLATGEGSYGFVPNLEDGCYEQLTDDWDVALQNAMKSIHEQIAPNKIKVLGIGISGQMHGEVLADDTCAVLGPVRLWCDARNEKEGYELTKAFNFKVPKRSTAARFLWTTRNRPNLAARAKHMTTPAGYIAYKLTGEWNLGIGDCSGMFPINSTTLNYDTDMMTKFDTIVSNKEMPSIASILPNVKKAGEDAGSLNKIGAELLGLPQGIPVAAGEGDQVAALAGSLIGKTGMVSCGFGTSVCANFVGDNSSPQFQGVSPLVDHYCTADGKPMHMVWLRNGTTFLNTIVESYGEVLSDYTGKEGEGDGNNNTKNPFEYIMPKLVNASSDCGGLLALPFMDDEPGLEVKKGGTAMIMGFNATNATVGNVTKAALLATMFNLKIGYCSVLDSRGYPRSTTTEILFTGGLTKTPECGQILSDVFNTPVTLFLESSDEGCAWGAAVMAKFRYIHNIQSKSHGSKGKDDNTNNEDCWSSYLDSIDAALHSDDSNKKLQFHPNPDAVPIYEESYQRYKKLIQIQDELSKV